MQLHNGYYFFFCTEKRNNAQIFFYQSSRGCVYPVDLHLVVKTFKVGLE